jgi:hypothetical protein
MDRAELLSALHQELRLCAYESYVGGGRDSLHHISSIG